MRPPNPHPAGPHASDPHPVGPHPAEQGRRVARIAVVGGGISGLVAAWRLRRHGQVVLLEQGPVVGGKLRVEPIGGLPVDVGAESLLARRPEAIDLIRELGLASELVHPAVTAARVVRAGTLRSLPGRTVMGVPADPSRLAGLLTPAEVARVSAERGLPPIAAGADDQDVAGWVGGRLGAAVTDWMVEPLLGGVYAGQAGLLSAQATLPGLWQAAVRTGTLLDGAAALLAQADPHAASPVFAGLRGGVATLPVRLAELLAEDGVQVRTGVTVTGLERTPDGWRLLLGARGMQEGHLAGQPGLPSQMEVDAVVLAVPAAPAARLLAAVCPGAAAELAEVETASVAVVACVIDEDPSGDSLAQITGSGFLSPPAEGHAVKALTLSSAKWAWLGDQAASQTRGTAVIRVSLGRHRQEQVLQRDDEELTALAVGDAARILGAPLVVRAARVVRWGGALPQYAVGHLGRVARIREQLARRPGLALCGAALDGVGVPACIASANSAAATVTSALGAVGGRARMPG